MSEHDDNQRNRKERVQRIKDAMGDTYNLGKLPPQAVDLEQAVLGALMLESSSFAELSDVLRPEVFYKEAHSKIYKAITDLARRSDPVDILTVTHQLRKIGELEVIGGPLYISQLTNRVASTANVFVHARLIVQYFMARELIRLCGEIQSKAYDPTNDIFDMLEETDRGLATILDENAKMDAKLMSAITDEIDKDIAERTEAHDFVSGVPTYLRDFDRQFGGFQPGDLIIMAARPSMGKTALALSMAMEQAKHDFPVAIFSLEMQNKSIVYRAGAVESSIDVEVLSKKPLDITRQRAWQMAKDRLNKLPIHIDDTASLSVFDFKSKAKRLVKKFGIKIIYVDYLQLMTLGAEGKGKNREQEISMISRTLKAVAKECNVPVVALSQLSRKVDERKENFHLPMLSDLRESGAIEQDADMVLFPYRKVYYMKDGRDENGIDIRNIAEIIVAKHRNGALGSAIVGFTEHLAHFHDKRVDGVWVPANAHSVDADKRLDPNESFLAQKSVVDPEPPYVEPPKEEDLPF